MDKVISRNDTADRGRFGHHQQDDQEEEDWWFASTAIPLIAATVGPLANVLSIAALVVSWRMSLVPDGWDQDPSTLLPELEGIAFPDPHWCYDLNAVSLACGFFGNLFLLANFTHRIRYIIALPASIILWYIATGLLIGITVSMNVHVPPLRPQETYTQGFWYGVIAAVLYLICSMALMVNMLGYFLGHYGQHFNLSEAQRTLILQTMMFFVWLAGGAGIFAKVETTYGHQGWLFTDALYFCDVTILTVGFGDLYPADDVGRGLVFPYTVGGTIMLGLVISSLTRFTAEISSEKVVRKRFESARKRTVERSQEGDSMLANIRRGSHRSASTALNTFRRRSVAAEKNAPMGQLEALQSAQDSADAKASDAHGSVMKKAAVQANKALEVARPKAQGKRKSKSRALLLREEKDRFDAMRHIQSATHRFKRYTALTASVIAFAMLWCVGAAVFFVTEKNTQDLSYFRSLYFAYVSLLTIGYGDEAPKSNAGRPFFVVWSLLAVPTMTILVSDMGDTVISSFKSGTSTLADFTILPKYGIWRNILNRNPWLLGKVEQHEEKKAAKKRLEIGFVADGEKTNGDNEEEDSAQQPTLDTLAQEEAAPPTEDDLARKLAHTIRRTAQHLKDDEPRRYSYEEWVEITELIRFSARKRRKRDGVLDRSEELLGEAETEEELIEWDWIGENSPMMAFGKSEPEFVLDRLCESMVRYIKAQAPEKG